MRFASGRGDEDMHLRCPSCAGSRSLVAHDQRARHLLRSSAAVAGPRKLDPLRRTVGPQHARQVVLRVMRTARPRLDIAPRHDCGVSGEARLYSGERVRLSRDRSMPLLRFRAEGGEANEKRFVRARRFGVERDGRIGLRGQTRDVALRRRRAARGDRPRDLALVRVLRSDRTEISSRTPRPSVDSMAVHADSGCPSRTRQATSQSAVVRSDAYTDRATPTVFERRRRPVSKSAARLRLASASSKSPFQYRSRPNPATTAYVRGWSGPKTDSAVAASSRKSGSASSKSPRSRRNPARSCFTSITVGWLSAWRGARRRARRGRAPRPRPRTRLGGARTWQGSTSTRGCEGVRG